MRIATLNVENLFTRFLFTRDTDIGHASRHGFSSEDLRFRLCEPNEKRMTAELMRACRADVFALQEVEDLDTLKRFRDEHLGGRQSWPHALVIDGNDGRKIDVGILSRLPIVHARSWQHLWDPRENEPRFDRDCLEVDVHEPGLGTVTLYINHFKSMRAPHGSKGPGRALTRERRTGQSRAVKAIVRERFGDDAAGAPFVVLGDLNDHLNDTSEGRSGIRPLVEWDAVENIVDRLPQDERWTHHFKGHQRLGLPEAYRQLDYILPSRGLAQRNPQLPEILRTGLPKRATAYGGKRIEGTGRHKPKASDHCPVVWDIRTV